MYSKLVTSILFSCLLACLATGCNDGRPARVPVAGRVLIDGEPVTEGLVKLANPGSRSAFGKIDSEGRFQMTCYEKNDGVIPGTHRVEVVAAEKVDERTTRWHAPKKYASKATSGIDVTIDEPTEDLVIELTWSGKKPFLERL